MAEPARESRLENRRRLTRERQRRWRQRKQLQKIDASYPEIAVPESSRFPTGLEQDLAFARKLCNVAKLPVTSNFLAHLSKATMKDVVLNPPKYDIHIVENHSDLHAALESHFT